MANYLNPSLLANGIDSLEGKYIGWLLLGTSLTNKPAFSNNFITSDSCIAGVMEPVKVSLSKIENGKLNFGNAYFLVNGSNTDNDKIPIVNGKDDGTLLNLGLAENTTFTTIATNNTSTTELVVRDVNSANSVIFPANINENISNSFYIDIGEGKGYVALVEYDYEDEVDFGTTSSDSEDSLVGTLLQEYKSASEMAEYNSNLEAASYVPGGSEDSSDKNFINYIKRVLFYYPVTPTSGLEHCNSYNYTGFSVGDISVTLNGLS